MASVRLSRYEAEEGDLPQVCMCCGEPAEQMKRSVFISHPVWIYVLLPFGWIPYAIVAAILTERVRCYVFLCSAHKNYWRNRALFVWGLFVVVLAVCFGSIALAANFGDRLGKSMQGTIVGSACFGSVLLIIAWLASIPISQLLAIHPAEVTERKLTLKRVSLAFVEAVEEFRASRPDEEPEERERPRRRKPSPSEDSDL